MTKIIGLTGGIGSGKTTIARFFEALGVPVYYADDRGKAITESPEILERIGAIFGKEMIVDGKLDRTKMADRVFQNPEALQKLNAIIHPAVQSDFENWVAKHKDYPYIIKEAAILFESGSYKQCDAILTVTAPEEIRISRVMQRNAISREAVLQRMKNQIPEEEKMAKSDYIIQNLDFETSKDEVVKIHNLLKIM